MDHATALASAHTPLIFWEIFFILIAALMAFDLGIMQRGVREITFRRSLLLSLIYMLVATLFGIGISIFLGAQQGLDFFTGYLIEKSLSADNIFIISVIFTQFSIPRHLKHRVLFWGIIGALLLRAVFIAIGAALVFSFHSVLYVFAAFLLFTGTRMLFSSHQNKDAAPAFVRWIMRHVPVTPQLHGHHFFAQVRSSAGKLHRMATPLFITLLCVECADILFAVDSVPAVFAVTTNPFIVYTSNIFAILGLRALYFTLDAMLYRFHYLSTALAAILIFIGSKIFISAFIVTLSSSFSLIITVSLLALGIVASLLFPQKQ